MSLNPDQIFGFGLSYTRFTYSNLQVRQAGEMVTAMVDLENSGERAGEEVVQLYIGFENSAVERPVAGEAPMDK